MFFEDSINPLKYFYTPEKLEEFFEKYDNPFEDMDDPDHFLCVDEATIKNAVKIMNKIIEVVDNQGTFNIKASLYACIMIIEGIFGTWRDGQVNANIMFEKEENDIDLSMREQQDDRDAVCYNQHAQFITQLLQSVPSEIT